MKAFALVAVGVILVAMSSSQAASAVQAQQEAVLASAGGSLPLPPPPEFPVGQQTADRESADDPAFGTWQNDFLAATDVIRQAHPDELAEVVVGDDGVSGRVAFRAAAPVDALDQLGVLGNVRVLEGYGYSEEDVSDAAERVYALAKQLLGPEAEINTSYDGSDGNFHVRYGLPDAAADTESDAHLQASMAAQLALPGGKRLVIDPDHTDLLQPQN